MHVHFSRSALKLLLNIVSSIMVSLCCLQVPPIAVVNNSNVFYFTGLQSSAIEPICFKWMYGIPQVLRAHEPVCPLSCMYALDSRKDVKPNPK